MILTVEQTLLFYFENCNDSLQPIPPLKTEPDEPTVLAPAHAVDCRQLPQGIFDLHWQINVV